MNSTSTREDRRRISSEIDAGHLKLLYLSPERLMTEQTLNFLARVPLSFFAIDEAHCVSDWGHDFRPEYRMLGQLRERFPGVNIHAYTATATERVRQDIAQQLGLRDPQVLVGSFDRPNLRYRVRQRSELMTQILEVVGRHPAESGIVYCMRRADVEKVCTALQQAGHAALPYHAGLSDEERQRHQDRFAKDQVNIIVATVAFGMGIDKPDVRYVIHAAAPKSLEHYQQESGRAGRDGLEAECHLFYSAGDFVVWRKLQMQSEANNAEAVAAQLAGIERFCTSLDCRHRTVVGYFGETLDKSQCGACDVCLEELPLHQDSLVVAQKILSCVVRLGERFGASYVSQVLVGSRDAKILERGHDRLSTFGLLADERRPTVRLWIDQLAGQGFLTATEDEYRLLQLTAEGRELLRGEGAPKLAAATVPAAKKRAGDSKASAGDDWTGVDRALFERLRAWRRDEAAERGVPPYVVFGDRTLRELARSLPRAHDELLAVSGVGEKKIAEYGAALLELIAEHQALAAGQ